VQAVRMVMDQIFGQLSSLQMEPEDLAFVDDSREVMNEISMDLDDFKFDFDTISDSLGPWIEPNDLKLNDIKEDLDLKSEPIDFEDINVSEAVRYDCMWSSSPSSIAERKRTQTLCENSLFEEFLKIIDIPTTNFDLDMGVKSDPEDNASTCDSIKTEDDEDSSVVSDMSIAEHENQVRMFTSLDHCYVSSTGPSDKHNYSSSFPVTPPESSEDDEESQNCAPYTRVINSVPTTCIQSKSLLKRPRSSGTGGEAKFCFRVKLKSDNKNSRSVLKQKLRLANSSGSSTNTSPTKRTSLGIMNRNMVQTNIRRRKEESLKVKHEEAREIHNHMERQRRNDLKLSFNELKAVIPNIAKSEKVSKQMILDTALENCKLLKSRDISMKMRIEKLKKGNAELKLRLQQLQLDALNRN